MSDTRLIPEALTQRFTSSTGKPRHKTQILNKKTGASIAVLTDPRKHAKAADEMVARYNAHDALVGALEAIASGFACLDGYSIADAAEEARCALAKAERQP